jgi:hypothetical protein
MWDSPFCRARHDGYDGLIVRDGGVSSIVKVIDGLVPTGRLETVLRDIGAAEAV